MLTCPFCDAKNSPTVENCTSCGAALDNGSSHSPADNADDNRQDGSASIDNDTEEELIGLLRSGKKIAAIKLYRERVDCGLKDAKDFVDALAVKRGVESQGGGCAGMLLFLSATLAAACIVICRLI